ncbi:MAG: hypothetical protein ACXAES_13960 [Promethearchaeota archaeon]|jgi:hypothetical protein
MGILMLTVWYPPHKSAEMAKLYLKSPREIPFVTKWRVFNVTDGKKGMKQYHLLYTEKGKLEEANIELNKYFLPVSQIEGVKMKHETLLGVQDSYKLLGLEWK